MIIEMGALRLTHLRAIRPTYALRVWACCDVTPIEFSKKRRKGASIAYIQVLVRAYILALSLLWLIFFSSTIYNLFRPV